MAGPRSKNFARSFIAGQLNINVLLGFAFGFVFVVVMLGFAAFFPNPTPFQIRVFVTVLALAAAGVGGVLPGYLEIRHQGVVRAGGSIALFVLVYLMQPVFEAKVIRFESPPEPPQPAAERYLAAVDAGDLATSWSLLDPAGRQRLVHSQAEYDAIYRNARVPLGPVQFRRQQGSNGAADLPGLPPGIFRQLNYITKFGNDSACRSEVIVTRATADISWKVFNHNISPHTFSCPPGTTS